MTKQYSRLSDPQWAAISGFFDHKRKRKHDLRTILDALLYLLRTGCQWRNLPDCFPPWQAVYWYFSQWKRQNLLSLINIHLNKLDRKREGLNENPSVFCIDSQSVKLSPMVWEDRGIDANKKVNGRKRQLLVDTGGRIWYAFVHAANLPDGQAALNLSAELTVQNCRLEKVYGDQAYNGIFAKGIKYLGLKFEKASRAESQKGFVPVAKRWVVERTITWTNYFRRTVKDVVGRRVIACVETLSCSILLVVQGHLLSAAAWARPSVYLFGNKSLPSGNKDIRSGLSASSFT